MSLHWRVGNNFSWFLGPFLLMAHSDHLIFGINSSSSSGGEMRVDSLDDYDSNTHTRTMRTKISISAPLSLAQIHSCYLNLIFPHRSSVVNISKETYSS